MTWLWHIKTFASLEILLLGYFDILMHLKMSISIYDQFVSEPDIPTSITLGLMYHFKCSSLLHHCIFRDYYPGFFGAHEIHIKDLTGIKNYKKLMPPLNSPPSICLQYVTSSKLKHLPLFVQNFDLEDDRWGVKNHRKLLSSMNSAPSNCSLCKILWKMVNLIPRSPFPIFHSPFPFLKTASYF